MSVSSELKKYVEDGDLIQTRYYIANYMIVDKTFALFDEALAYAQDNLPIIQEYDGQAFEQNRALWNRDYLSEQMVALYSNFSKERIEHIKEVVHAIAGEKSATTDAIVSGKQPDGSIYITPRTGKTTISEVEIPSSKKTTPSKRTIPQKETISTNAAKSRTGRRTLSETEVDAGAKENAPLGQTSNHYDRKPTHRSHTESEEKTDKSSVHSEKNRTIDIGTAMIVGGAAIAVLGAAVVKPVVIGAGVAVAGVGFVAKAAGDHK